MSIVKSIVSGLTAGHVSRDEVSRAIQNERRVIAQQEARGGAADDPALARHRESLANLQQALRETSR